MSRKEDVPNRRYTLEYKIEAVRLSESIGGSQAAKRLEIPSSSIWNWIRLSRAGKLQAGDHDHVSGAGLGLVDVFDANGKFGSHLVPLDGVLNAPWGIALAPGDFGTLSNSLLVGNVGDGKINAFDPTSGQFAGGRAGFNRNRIRRAWSSGY